MTPADKEFLEVVIGTFVVPVLYFLALVLFLLTGYALLQASRDVNYIVVGALLFVLGYNAARAGWRLRA